MEDFIRASSKLLPHLGRVEESVTAKDLSLMRLPAPPEGLPDQIVA